MKTLKFSFLFVLAFLSMFLLSACSTLTGSETAAVSTQTTQQALPVLPTQLSGQQLKNFDSQACIVKEFAVIGSTEDQGDLIAWSPVSDILAFVTPENQVWGWFVGMLTTYDPAKDVNGFTTKDQSVFGDVTWSPDGSSIAFVTYNQASQNYQVNIIDNLGQSSVEVFGTGTDADTDSYGSRKGILEWTLDNQLLLTSSCGVDCIRNYQYSLNDSSLKGLEEIRKSEDTSLIPNSEGAAPNGKWVVTVDTDNNVWFSSVVNNQAYLLLATTQVKEIKWSESSRYFALRTAEKVTIYNPTCFTSAQ